MAKIIRDNELVWNPSKGIGPFQIGVKIKEYIQNLDVVDTHLTLRALNLIFREKI